MDPQKRFITAAAHIEQALACALDAVIDSDHFSPEQLERMLKLITKKEIIFSLLLDDIKQFDFKPQKRKHTFKNTNPIWIPAEGFTGPANPYPSTIQVSGLRGIIKKVTVTLKHLYHTWPRDIHVLLVGPNGRNILLMSTIGAGTTFENLTITFDDEANSQLPPIGPFPSGRYQPTPRSRMNFPPPAPQPSMNTHLSIFNGYNPNGIWQLFVLDVFSNDTDIMAGGWEITITTEDPKSGKTYTSTMTEDFSSENVAIDELRLKDESSSFEDFEIEWENEDMESIQIDFLKKARSKTGQEATSDEPILDDSFPEEDT